MTALLPFKKSWLLSLTLVLRVLLSCASLLHNCCWLAGCAAAMHHCACHMHLTCSGTLLCADCCPCALPQLTSRLLSAADRLRGICREDQCCLCRLLSCLICTHPMLLTGSMAPAGRWRQSATPICGGSGKFWTREWQATSSRCVCHSRQCQSQTMLHLSRAALCLS